MVTLAPPSLPTSRTPKIGFRSDIQGLRAVAVLLVVIYHAGATTISGGYIGVDVFFVISGFLITTHLLESLKQHGRIRLGQFYAKRARRILPAAFTVLLGTVISAMIWMPPLMLESVFQGAIATAVYMPNMFFAREGTDYLAETAPSVFQHYWSLGIEEQFYLVWPLALLFFYRRMKSERSMFGAVLALVVASFALCVYFTPIEQPWAFFSLPTRAWELGVGALVAFVMRAHAARLAAWRTGALAWIGLVLLLLIAVTYDSATPFPSYLAAGPAIATALIIAGGVGRSGPSRLLSTRPLQFIGLISYSLYLLHWPLLVIPQAAVGLNNPLPLWVTLALGGLSVPLAYLLYRFVEDPARKAKYFTPAKPHTTLIAVAVTTAGIASVSLAAMSYTQHQPLHAEKPTVQTDVRLFPEGTHYVPSNLQPTLRNAADDIAMVSTNGCHRDLESDDASGCLLGSNPDAPVVALFGDSHAAAWSSALLQMAEEGDIQLDVNTKSACRSADVPIIRNNVLYTSCETWRDDVIRRLSAEQPDVVLLTNFGAEIVEPQGPISLDAWTQGLTRTIEAMPSKSTVGVIADTPDMGETPAICLSANLNDAEDCNRPRDIAIQSDLVSAERQAIQSVGGTYVDLTDYLCGTEFCPAIIGNRLVYRDGNHITPTMGNALSHPMAKQLEHLLD